LRTKIFLLVLAAAALALPAGSLAAKKKSTYELKGTFSAYTAPVGLAPGSITILVRKTNKAGHAFVGQTLVFALDASTKVGPAGVVILDGDRGSVQVKGAPGLDAIGLQAVVPRKVQDETAEEAPPPIA
jgi:hypothetical protein